MSGTQPPPSLFVFGTSSSFQAAGTPSSTPAFKSGTLPPSSLFVFGTSSSSLAAGTPSSTPAFMSGTQPPPSLFVFGTSSSSLAAGTPSSTPAFMSGTQPPPSLFVFGTSSSSLSAGTPSSTPAFMSRTQPPPSLFVFGTSPSSLAAGTPSSTPAFMSGTQPPPSLFVFGTSSSSLAAGTPSSTPAFMSGTQPPPSLFVFGTSSSSLAAGTPSSTLAFDTPSSTPAFDTPSSTLAFGTPSMPSFATGFGSSLFSTPFATPQQSTPFGQLNPFSLPNAQATTQMAPIAQSTQSEKTLIKLEDSIDQLPDEILGGILSFLTMKEAARTSVLSRRWKYLWIFTTCLDFDDSQMVLARRSLEIQRRRFVDWVNHALRLYQGQTIDKFKVCFDLDEKNSKSDIDNWIKFALGKRVKQLKLAFASSQGYFGHGSYTLTTQFLRDHCFDSLTALQLHFVEVTGEDLQYILLNSQFLQVLCVEASKSLVILEIPCPDLRLKCLEILHCSSIEYMDISGNNLVSFKYYGPEIKISFKDVPRLVEASIGGRFASFLVDNIFQFSSSVSCLETLVLDVSVQKYLTFPKFPTLQNLKQLDLWLNGHNVDSLLFCTSLLKASPMLLMFTLKIVALGARNHRKLEKKKNKHPYQCLKLVEIVGFVGCITDFEFVLHLLHNAVSLEKIIIDPHSPYALKSRYNCDDSDAESAARARARQLETVLPPGVELVIL